jgi:hypothetical protein
MSLRDDIQAAVDEHAEPAEGVEAVAAIPEPVEAAEGQEEAPAEAPTKADGRDEKGRFAKPAEMGQDEPTEPAQPTIRPPASWSATAKAQFNALDPVIQQEVLRREKDIEAGKAQWDSKAAQFNKFEAIVGPRREKLALAGVDEYTAVQQLFAAQDFLERSPLEGIRYLANQYGVGHLFAAQQQGQSPQPQGIETVLQPFQQEIQALKQTVEVLKAAPVEARQREAEQVIAAFMEDPAHAYAPNLEQKMGALIQTGQAQGATMQEKLKSAYEMACWADPEVRQILIKEQDAARQAKLTQDTRTKAEKARALNGSVNGSPGLGAALPKTATGNLRDDIMAAYQEVGGRA